MSLEKNYDFFKIKDYQYWSLFLHEYQCYLGRVYLVAKRDDAKDFSEISFDEREELFLISKKIKKALEQLFLPDKMNYAALGNVFEHLHVHLIPRYKTRRIFEGIEFIDKRWGENYAPYDKSFLINSNIIYKIKTSLEQKL